MRFTWQEQKRRTNLARRCGRPKNMSNKPTSDHSAVNADLDEAPPLTAADWQRAVHRVGLKPVTTPKTEVTIPLDADVLAWLEERASTEDYPTLINGALRDIM